MKLVFKFIFQVVIISLITIIFFEIFLRILPQKFVGSFGPNKANLEFYDFGPWFAPNQKFSFAPQTVPPCFISYPITTNSHGMRSAPVDLIRNNNKKLRVAVLGDSVSEGLQVSDEYLFSNLMNINLKKYKIDNEILNFGFSGYGTAQQLFLYEKKVKYFNPDIVLLFVTASNDLRNNSMYLDYKTYGNQISDYGTDLAPPFSYIEFINNELVWFPNKRQNNKLKQILKKYILYKFYSTDILYQYYIKFRQHMNILSISKEINNELKKENEKSKNKDIKLNLKKNKYIK